MMKRIDIAPYPCVLYITNDREEYLVERKRHTDMPFDVSNVNGIASDFENGTLHVVGAFQGNVAQVLVHELTHVCIKVFTAVGMSITQETSEAFCYLLDSLLDQSREVFITSDELQLSKESDNMSLQQVRALTREALNISIESLQYPQVSLEEMYEAREEVGDVITESLYDYNEQTKDRETVERIQTVSDEVSRTLDLIEGTDVLTGGDVEILNTSLESLTRIMGHDKVTLELGENGKLTQASMEGLGDFFANLVKSIAGVVKRAKARMEINRNRDEGYLTGIRKQLAFCHNGMKENLTYQGGDEITLPTGWAEAFTIAGSPSKDYARDVKTWLEFTGVVYNQSIPFRLKTAETALAGLKALVPGDGLDASLKKAWAPLKPDTSILKWIGSGRHMVFNRLLEPNKAIKDHASMPEYARDVDHICTKMQWLFSASKHTAVKERKQPDAATAKQWMAALDALVKQTEGQLYNGGGQGRKYWNEYERLIDQLSPALEAMESKIDRGGIKTEQSWAINGLAHCVGTVLDVLTDDMAMVNSYSMRLSSALAWCLEEWIQKARKEA